MSKNKIIIALLILLSIGVISLYTTYGYEGNNTIFAPSNSDENIMISLKESTNKEITINANEDKFIDISLNNTYESTIRYGMYYYMINPEKLPDNVMIKLSEDSEDAVENIIKPGKTRNVSIKISNKSEYTIRLIIGALIGFEHGEIEELVTNGEILIK